MDAPAGPHRQPWLRLRLWQLCSRRVHPAPEDAGGRAPRDELAHPGPGSLAKVRQAGAAAGGHLALAAPRASPSRSPSPAGPAGRGGAVERAAQGAQDGLSPGSSAAQQTAQETLQAAPQPAQADAVQDSQRQARPQAALAAQLAQHQAQLQAQQAQLQAQHEALQAAQRELCQARALAIKLGGVAREAVMEQQATQAVAAAARDFLGWHLEVAAGNAAREARARRWQRWLARTQRGAEPLPELQQVREWFECLTPGVKRWVKIHLANGPLFHLTLCNEYTFDALNNRSRKKIEAYWIQVN